MAADRPPSSGPRAQVERLWHSWRGLRSSWRRRKVPVIGVQEAYGMWARDYGRPPNEFQILEQASLVKLLPELDQQVVLDLGCGTGRIGRLVLDRGAARAFGVDTVLPMLARASAEAHPKTAWAAAKAMELPFSDGIFGVVVSALMLGHIGDLAAALREISRVMHPHGVLMISDFHPRASQRGWLRTVTDSATGKEYAIEHHLHPLAEYHRQLARLGLSIEAFEEPRHEGFPVAFVMRARKDPAADG